MWRGYMVARCRRHEQPDARIATVSTVWISNEGLRRVLALTLAERWASRGPRLRSPGSFRGLAKRGGWDSGGLASASTASTSFARSTPDKYNPQDDCRCDSVGLG